MTQSQNPLTGEEFELPKTVDDRAAILDFLARNPAKKVIVVQGLGFVGAVMSLVCANAVTTEYAVIGVDLLSASTYWRIRSLNDGQFPLVADDPLIEIFYRRALDQGNFFATFDPLAYEFADIVIVDINLDVQKESGEWGELNGFDVDLTHFKSAMRALGSRCREDVLILIETTVPPGTCQQVVKPIIDEEFANRSLPVDRYRLGHSYERVMPGPEYIESIRSYPRVYAGIAANSADDIEAFLETIIDTNKCQLSRLGSTNASEMAKVLENSYRAMNISFVVEWTKFAEEAEVNLYEIVSAIRARKSHANLMLPGIGVGGYCLTKDPLLASWSRMKLFHAASGLEKSVKAVATNDRMPVYAFERLKRVFGDLSAVNVAVLGVAYRGDVGDTRFSPVNLFVDCLNDAGAIMTFHDPYVTYWPERSQPVLRELADVLSTRPAIAVFCTGHKQYTFETTIDALMACPPLMVFDTIGLLSQSSIDRLASRHVVKVLGRGDI